MFWVGVLSAMPPQIEFEPKAHIYKVDGLVVPSVTEIINATVPKPFDRAAWYGYKVARQGKRLDDTRNAAAKRGTQVHLAFRDWAMGCPPDPFDYPDLDGFLEGLERFIDANDPDFHDSERWTASLRYKYAGTLDAFCTFRKGKYKGATARIDLKTGRIYPESHWPQLEAYEAAEIERGGGASDARLVLAVKEGKYRFVESTDTFQDFKVLLRHYESIQARKKRKK